MKGWGSIFLIVVLGASLIGALYYFKDSLGISRTLSSSGSAPNQPDPAEADDETAPPPAAKRSAVPKVEPDTKIVLTRPAAKRLKRRFPVATEINPGSSRGSIWREFGSPDLRTTTVFDGRLVERFVYVDEGSDQTTVAFLEDGEVINAVTEKEKRTLF